MTPSINIAYVLVKVYDTLLNIPFDPGSLPGTFVFFVETVATIGMVLSVVLLVLLVYVRIRLIQVEHHGFLIMEERERAKRQEEERTVKNSRWEMVSGLSSSQSESDWRRAILEADIMLASLLSERGYPGETLGEQLKQANPLQFTTLDLAWEAHRMRNAIAHLGDAFPLTQRDVTTTINQYQRVFEEFDYI